MDSTYEKQDYEAKILEIQTDTVAHKVSHHTSSTMHVHTYVWEIV